MEQNKLTKQNPWWEKKDATVDRYNVAWDESTVKWIPFTDYNFDLNKDAIYSIRGPRQTGKTTFLKRIIIKKLLGDGTNPTNIFYWACDSIKNQKKLVELINSFFKFSATTEERKYIFLDEISSVPRWQDAIKHLANLGKLKNCTIVVTGSHSLDVKKGTGSLSFGGAKKTPGTIFLPMKFSEYAKTLNKNMKEAINAPYIQSGANPINILESLLEGNMSEEIKFSNLYSKELITLFENYLITGGVPNVVNYFQENRKIPKEIYNDCLTKIFGDLTRWNLKEEYLGQVIRRIIETFVTPISWRNLMDGADIAAHTTVEKYVSALSAAFILSYIYPLDLNSGQPRYFGNKKIYFSDPFFFHALNAKLFRKDPFEISKIFLSNPENKSKLIKCIISNHLIRLTFNLFHSTQYQDYTNFLFYWRDKKGRELDFALKINEEYLPIGIKYSSSIKKSDLIGIRLFMMKEGIKNGIVISKNILKKTKNITIIPAHVFLFMV